MKRIVFWLIFAALAFTSCSRPATPEVTVPERIPLSEEATAEAVALLEKGDLYAALETALSTYGTVEAQRVIADVSGAYSNRARLFTRGVTLDGEIESVELINRNRTAVAATSESLYLVGVNSGELILSLPKGLYATDGECLYVMTDMLRCYDGRDGKELWSVEAKGVPYGSEGGVVTVDGNRYTVYDNMTNAVEELYSAEMTEDIVAVCLDRVNRLCLFDGREAHVVCGPIAPYEFKPLAVTAGAEGDFYALCNGFLTNGDWVTEYEAEEGYLHILFCPVTASGSLIEGCGDLLAVANQSRLTLVECETGRIAFDTSLDSPVSYIDYDGETLSLSTGRFFTPKGVLSFEDYATKEKKDSFKFGELYTLDGVIATADRGDGAVLLATESSRELRILKKVTYTHRVLDVEKSFPTAIGDNAEGYAVGTYDYIDKKRYNYLVYPDGKGGYAKTEVDFEIKEIIWSKGWHLYGAEGEYAVVDGEPKELTPPEKITYGSAFELGNISYTALDNRITDENGNFAETDFQMNNESQFFAIDGNTLLVTEYRYAGKSAIIKLDSMKIQATPTDAVYYSRARNAILYKSNSYGEYEYLNQKALAEYGESFLENNGR